MGINSTTTQQVAIIALYLISSFLSNGVAGGETGCGEIRSVVYNALEAWKSGNWKHMYELMSKEDKENKSISEFIKKRKEIALSVNLDGYKILSIKKTGKDKAQARIRLNTRFGPGASYFPTEEWRIETNDVVWVLIREDCWKLSFSNKEK